MVAARLPRPDHARAPRLSPEADERARQAPGSRRGVCSDGLSAKDAEWFLGELSARGVAVIVSGDVTRLEPGADHSDIVRRVASAQNVHHVRQAKRRAARSR